LLPSGEEPVMEKTEEEDLPPEQITQEENKE